MIDDIKDLSRFISALPRRLLYQSLVTFVKLYEFNS